MSAQQIIIAVGEALYGARFQRELADNLHVNERTMRRWVAGDCEPPAGVLKDLLELVTARVTTLKSVEHLIKGEMRP